MLISALNAIDANSYVTVQDADDYFVSRGISGWSLLSNLEKEQALIRATDYLEATYYRAWIGRKETSSQSLSWPRIDAYYDEHFEIFGIPSELKRATYEMAIRASKGELVSDQEQRIIKEKVDVLEVTYYEHGDQATRFDYVNRILKPIIKSAGNSTFQSVSLNRV